MATVPQTHPSQSIAVTVRAAGELDVIIDTHGRRTERGAYISVMAAGVAVYLYTASAAETYSNAWIDLAASPSVTQLPHLANTGAHDRRASADSPAIVVTAHGWDFVKHHFVPADDTLRGGISIQVGRVRWVMEDRAAYQAYAEAWRQVHNLIPIVLGPVTGHRPLA